GLTYVLLASIPRVSWWLAVVDMDLERSKHGGFAGGSPALSRGQVPAYRSPFAPRPPVQAQPKTDPPTNGKGPSISIPPTPYAQGYGGNAAGAGSPFGTVRPPTQVPTP